MAKSKRNVDDFQKAMLANTKKIKENPESDKEAQGLMENAVTISPETLEKVKLFAKKHKLQPEAVAELALNHFMDLETYWFKK